MQNIDNRAYEPYTLVGPPVWGLVLAPLIAFTSTTVYKFPNNVCLIHLVVRRFPTKYCKKWQLHNSNWFFMILIFLRQYDSTSRLIIRQYLRPNIEARINEYTTIFWIANSCPIICQYWHNIKTKLVFIRRQNFDAGKNILLNRLCSINNVIEKEWLNLGLDSFKIKCKKIFLNW